jgi:2-oxoglutarate ferredoxin oxidoreductase subunit gamma
MYQDIVIAGFGGQGIMLMGRMLAYAGMKEGRKVLWIPSYGPEMRGGSANCTVILSDEEIGSPVVTYPLALVAMNQPSLDRFEPNLQSGGVLMVNSSMVARSPKRTDIEVVNIPATEVADELGNPKVANIVMLGAVVEKTALVSIMTMLKVLEETFKAKPDLLEINISALKTGAEVFASRSTKW